MIPQKEDVTRRLREYKQVEFEKQNFWGNLKEDIHSFKITKGILFTTSMYCTFFLFYFILVVSTYEWLSYFPMMTISIIFSLLTMSPPMLEALIIVVPIFLGGLLLVGIPILPFALIKGWKGEKGTNLNLTLMSLATTGLFIIFTIYQFLTTGRVFYGHHIAEGTYTYVILGQNVLHGLVLTIWVFLLGKIGIKVGKILEKRFG